MRLRKFVLPVAVLAVMLATTGVANACPNCKEAVANQEGSDAEGLRNGYGWSIIMMISAPFSMITAGAFVVARAAKRGSLPEF
jgi:hypothetical protein